VNSKHAVETLFARAALGALDGLSWPAALRVGAGLGDTVRRLGIRARVARANLALAFPERSTEEREALLHAHYLELGRIAAEYGRLPRLAHAPDGEVMGRADGREHLEPLVGRGALLLSGHYGNFELAAAWCAKLNPVDFLVRPLSNPGVEERILRLRRDAGVGVISTHGGVKQVIRALRAGHWIAIIGDQDARRFGLFVPFFGRLASTPEGPARISLQTGAPIVSSRVRRMADGRHAVAFEPPREADGPPTPENVLALTAWHASRLEACVREAPEHWFWLHRRWKTPAPAGASPGGRTDASL
jgi:KDO2-lipid IV(A) lauroyltransferase